MGGGGLVVIEIFGRGAPLFVRVLVLLVPERGEWELRSWDWIGKMEGYDILVELGWDVIQVVLLII